MTDYTPKRDREKVLITLSAEYMAPYEAAGPAYAMTGLYDEDGEPVLAVALPDRIVRVEPAPHALPTEFGARILAHREQGREPIFLVLGESNGAPVWYLAGAVPFETVPAGEILPDWVRIDPDTLRPIED